AHEEPKPQGQLSPETITALLAKVEQAVSGVNDAHITRVMAMEGQLRTLSRQLQEVLPHPVDAQDIARRLDTLGAAIPQPKLNHMEARMGRLETMVANLCTHAGMEVPPAPMLSRLPSDHMKSQLPAGPAGNRLGALNDSKLPAAGSESRAVTESKNPSSPSQRPPSLPPSQRPSATSADRSPSTPSAPNSAVPAPPSSLPPRAPRPRRTEQL